HEAIMREFDRDITHALHRHRKDHRSTVSLPRPATTGAHSPSSSTTSTTPTRMSSTPPSTCSQIAHTARPSSPAHSPTLPATTPSPSRTWTSPLFASTATGKASNDPQRRDPGGLPHVPGGDGRAEHRHGARPYRCLPNPSPVTRHRE